MTNSNVIDDIFGKLNRPLWVVTAAKPNRIVSSSSTDADDPPVHPMRGGLLATWISQASISPSRPVVSAGIAPNHFTCELVDSSNAFALHLLSADQIDLAHHFCSGSGRNRDKLAELGCRTGSTGAPILENCLAYMECRVFARLDGGDRIYYWADVVDSDTQSTSELLTEHIFFAALSDSQRKMLREDRERDVKIQDPQCEAWRADIPANLQPR